MPVVTFVLIALNVLFFFVELNGGDAFIRQWAFIPRGSARIPPATCPPSSPPCSCTAAGCIWAATCFTCGFSATTSRTSSGRSNSSIFYLRVRDRGDFRAVLRLAAAPTFPTSVPRAPSPACSAATCCCFPHARVRVLVYNQIVAMPAMIVLGLVDRAAGVQRRGFDCADRADRGPGRRRLHGARRRVRGRLRARASSCAASRAVAGWLTRIRRLAMPMRPKPGSLIAGRRTSRPVTRPSTLISRPSTQADGDAEEVRQATAERPFRSARVRRLRQSTRQSLPIAVGGRTMPASGMAAST